MAAHHAAYAAAATYYVGTCKPVKPDFLTIQAAVNQVPAGSTIDICPGTYPEQVTITKPLSLQGVVSSNGAAAIIAAPTSGALQATIPLTDGSVAQILVFNPGGPVNISKIAVDGTGLGDSYAPSESIGYYSASGTIDRVVIQKIPTSDQYGAAISIQDEAGVSPTVSVENSSIDSTGTDVNYNVGILAGSLLGVPSTGTTTITISNNVVNSETAIQPLAGVIATISGNLIEGGTGMDVNTTNQPVKIANNTVVNTYRGIQVDSAASVTITGNTIASSYAGMWLSGVPTATVNGNQLVGVGNSASNPVSGIDFRCSALTLTASGNAFQNLATALADVVQDTGFPTTPGTYAGVQTITTLCN